MNGDEVTDVEGLRLIAWSLEGGNVKMADECRRAADEIVRLRADLGLYRKALELAMQEESDSSYNLLVLHWLEEARRD